MAVNFAGTPQASSGYGKTCTASLPSGIQVGERLYIVFSKNLDTADDMTAPAGWVEVDSYVRAYHCLQKVYERVADGSEGVSVDLWHAKNSDWSAIAFRSDSLGVGVSGTNELLGTGVARACPDITTSQTHSSVLRFLTVRDSGSNISIVSDVSKPSGILLGEELGNTTYTGLVYSDHESAEAVGTSDFLMPDGTNSYSVLATTLELLGAANTTLHSLTDIDIDEITEDGQTNISFDYANSSVTPTSLVYTNGGHATGNLLLSASNGSGVFNAPVIQEGVVGVPFGALTCEITDGTDTATLAITHNPAAGEHLITISSAVTGEGTFFEEGASIPDTSQVVVPDEVTGLPDGTYVTALTTFDGKYRNATTGVWELFTVNVQEVVVDSTPPTIVLSGLSSYSLNEGDAWSEPGYSASDNIDGDITASVVISGDAVDPNTAGTYVIRYNVVDAAGNAATEVTRTVTVNDITLPIITLTGSTSISINEGDAWADPGFSATDNVDGDISANVTVGGDAVDPNTVGIYIITYDVSDAAGNNATQVTRTVTVLDATAPIITLLGSPTVQINEGDAWIEPGYTASDNVDGDITGSVVVAGDAVNPNAAGTYVITYNVSDAAGNAAAQVTRTVTVVDITAPVITLVGSTTISVAHGSVWTDPGFTAIDNTDGDISADVVIGGTAVNTNQAGTYVLTYNVSDAAGNNAVQVIRAVTVEPKPITYAAYASVVGMGSSNTQKLFLNELTDPQQWESADLSIIIPVK